MAQQHHQQEHRLTLGLLIWCSKYLVTIWSSQVALSEWLEVAQSCPTPLWPRGLYSLWNSLGQNTGVGSLSLLQGIFPTQGLNPGLPHCRQILSQLSHRGSPQVALVVKNPLASAGEAREVDLIPESGRSSGERHANPLQYSYLENPTDRGVWRATVHRVTKSQTQLKLLSTSH